MSTVQIRGLRELGADMGRLARQLESDAQAAGRERAQAEAARARATVPRRTGRLAGTARTGTAGKALFASLGRGVAYGGWINFGGTRGRPYVRTGRYLRVRGVRRPYVDATGRRAVQTVDRFRWSNTR